MVKIRKRTCRKSEAQKAVRKQLSMRGEIWRKADDIADREGRTRSSVVAEAINLLWETKNNAA